MRTFLLQFSDVNCHIYIIKKPTKNNKKKPPTKPKQQQNTLLRLNSFRDQLWNIFFREEKKQTNQNKQTTKKTQPKKFHSKTTWRNSEFCFEKALPHWSSPLCIDQGMFYVTRAELKRNLTSPELTSRRWSLLKYIHWTMPSLILNITFSWFSWVFQQLWPF